MHMSILSMLSLARICWKDELGSNLAFERYCFNFKLLWVAIILLLLPPHLQSLPYCNTIAGPLRNIPPPPLPLYVIYHRLLVMAMSCKGQGNTRVVGIPLNLHIL